MTLPHFSIFRDAPRDPGTSSASLRTMETLEEEVATEVRRLSAAPAARRRTNGEPLAAGRRVSWWRDRLARWLQVEAVRAVHPADLLRGLAAALGDFDDRQLQEFVESLSEQKPRRASTGRPQGNSEGDLHQPSANAERRREEAGRRRPPDRAV